MKKIFFLLVILGCIICIAFAQFHPFIHGTYLQAIQNKETIDIMWLARLQIMPFIVYFLIFAGFTKNNNTILLYFTGAAILVFGFIAVFGTPKNPTNEVQFFTILWANLLFAVCVPILNEIIQDRKRVSQNFNHR